MKEMSGVVRDVRRNRIRRQSMRVIFNCCPMNDRKKKLSCANCIYIDIKLGSCSIRNLKDKQSPTKHFTVDGAYDANSTKQQIYSDIVFLLVEGVTEGYNGTVFAYGQTGCGKTYSMQGMTDDRGVIPLAFD